MNRWHLAGIFLAGLALQSSPSAVAAGLLYAIQDDTRNLISIDPDSLVVTTIGSTGVAEGNFGDLAYDEASGVMYWIAGRGNDQLYTINLGTGAATLVGSHGISDLFSLASDGTDLFAQATNGSVYTLDAGTAAATLIGSNGIYPGGYDWNGDTGQLISLAAGSQIFSDINRTNGTSTFLGAGGGFINDNDVAYDADRGLYWAGDWSGDLYAFNAGTYSGGVVLGGIGLVASLEYLRGGVIPEPATLAMCVPVAVVGVGVALRRRRHAG